MASTPITIELPKTNTAEAWNTAVKEGAEKAGVELPKPGESAAAAAATKTEEPKIYESSLEVNGKTITVSDADPQKLIEKLGAAVAAAQAATEGAPAAAKEEPKPAFTEAELFDIGLKVQKGDLSILEDYIDRSGALDRILEKRGITVADLKNQVEERKSQKTIDGWKDATVEFMAKVKAGEIDYITNPQNTRLMGYQIAAMGLKPSVENMIKAWDALKENNLYFPTAEKQTTTTTARTETTKTEKTAASSTAIGTHGTPSGEERGAGTTNQVVELDIRQMTPSEYREAYNTLVTRFIAAGVPKDQIKDRIKVIQ